MFNENLVLVLINIINFYTFENTNKQIAYNIILYYVICIADFINMKYFSWSNLNLIFNNYQNY